MLNPALLPQPTLPLLDRPSQSPEDCTTDRALNLNILIRETLEGDLIARVLEFPDWVVQTIKKFSISERLIY